MGYGWGGAGPAAVHARRARTNLDGMCEHSQQTSRSERRQHLQTLVLLGSLIVRQTTRGAVPREFVVFSAAQPAQ